MYRGNRDTILKKIFYQFAKLMSVSTSVFNWYFFSESWTGNVFKMYKTIYSLIEFITPLARVVSLSFHIVLSSNK